MNNNPSGGEGHNRPPEDPARGAIVPAAENGTKPAVDNSATRVRPAPKDGRRPASASGGKPRGGKKRHGKIRASTVAVTVILNILKSLLVMVCIVVIAFSVVAVQMVEYVVAETQNDENVLDLEHIKLNQTSFIMALNGENPNAEAENDWVEYQELIGPENRIWVPLEEIPDYMVQAVVATEDKEFYEHHGVNFRRTIYALANELLEFEDTFGASTIEQQLVKNITGEGMGGGMTEGSEGYQRKMREIFRAWGLDNKYSKDMIMEAYLNTFRLSERIAGVQAAASEYFNKDNTMELSLSECATIAGITQAPTYYSPYQNPDNCLKRRNDVLSFMLRDGYITQQQFDEAVAEELHVTKRTTKDNSEESRVIFNYFSDTVFNEVVDDMVEQMDHINTRADAINELYTGGYRIYATVEDKVQKALEDMYLDGYNPETGYFLDWNRFPNYEGAMTAYDKDGNPVLPQSAAAVINYDGELVGVIGGIGEKTVSLGLNRAVGTVKYNSAGEAYVDGTVRQVGSTMKMTAAYPLGLDTGVITYSTGVTDGPVLAVPPGGPINWPTNYGSNPGTNAPFPVVSAVSESKNTVAVRVGSYVGEQPMYEFLTDILQVTSLVEPEDVALAPLVLGSMTHGMSAYELAGCYMMYGGETDYGVYNSLHCYTKVEDSKGNIVLQPERTTVQAIDPQTGYVGNRMMSTVLNGGAPGANPTALGMSPAGDMDAVGKTGTTSEDNDRWFVGLTPYYVTAVWWGYDANDNSHTLGTWGPGAYTNPPPNVWKSLMETVQADKPYKEFPAVPQGITQQYYCTISGGLARPGCPAQMGYYTNFAVPDYCGGHAAPPGADEEGEEGGEGGGEAPAEAPAEGGGEPAG